MIARPPKIKPFLKAKPFSPLFSKVANDNRPPHKHIMGWLCLGGGVLLLLVGFFLDIKHLNFNLKN